MPPARTASKNTAFKPPRRISDNSNTSDTGASKTTGPRAAAARASKASAPASSSRASAFKPATTLTISDSDLDDIDDDDLDGGDVDDSTHRRRSTNATTARDTSATEIAVPAPSQDDLSPDNQPPIPAKLLNRLLHEGFEDEDMRIGKEAMAVASKYIETFVREALARAMYEREEADQEERGAGDGFLQVEDLEKLAPQLLLDF